MSNIALAVIFHRYPLSYIYWTFHLIQSLHRNVLSMNEWWILSDASLPV